METVFSNTDNKLSEITKENPDIVHLSGCTASVLLVQEDYFVISNAGDSPIILFRMHPEDPTKL